MATVTAPVTGTVSDVTLTPMYDKAIQLEFTLNRPATAPGFILPQYSIVVDPESHGFWTTALVPNELIDGPSHYDVAASWLEPDFFTPGAGMRGANIGAWEIWVPIEGGTFTDLVEQQLNPSHVWDSPTGAIPNAARPGDLLFNSTTKWLNRIIA